jgi:hypothetical protein
MTDQYDERARAWFKQHQHYNTWQDVHAESLAAELRAVAAEVREDIAKSAEQFDKMLGSKDLRDFAAAIRAAKEPTDGQ